MYMYISGRAWRKQIHDPIPSPLAPPSSIGFATGTGPSMSLGVMAKSFQVATIPVDRWLIPL